MLVLVLLAIAAGLGWLGTTYFIVRKILAFGPSKIFGPVARIDGLTWEALWTTFFAILLAVSYHELRAGADRLVEVFE